jgi:hypothetical protein
MVEKNILNVDIKILNMLVSQLIQDTECHGPIASYSGDPGLKSQLL